MPTPSSDTHELRIHDDSGAQPQFVEHAWGADLVLDVDPSALATFSLEGAELFPDETVGRPLTKRTPGMKLRGGAVAAAHPHPTVDTSRF